MSEKGSDSPFNRNLTHRFVQASKNPVDIYDNAVLTPEELPIAKRPKYYPWAKGALLILCSLGIIHGLYSLSLGAYAQSRGGFLYSGLHDMPYKAVIASFFVGGFTFAVSLTLFTVAYRDWHPSLITFGLFVIFVIFSDVAMDRLLAPGPLLREQQYLAFRQVPAATAKRLVTDLGCCGYLNSSACKLSEWGIPQGPGVTTGVVQSPVPDPTAPAPAPVSAAAAKVKRSADQDSVAKKLLFRRQQTDSGAINPDAAAPAASAEPDAATPGEPAGPDAATPGEPAGPDAATPGEPDGPDAAAPAAPTGPDAAAPVAPAAPAAPDAAAPVAPAAPGATATAPPIAPAEPVASVIPQNGPGVPLPNNAPVPTFDPNVGAVNNGAVNAPLVDSGYPTCDRKLNPLIDRKLMGIRIGYIVGAVLSCLQLVFLGAFWHILGQWKRARGVGRW